MKRDKRQALDTATKLGEMEQITTTITEIVEPSFEARIQGASLDDLASIVVTEHRGMEANLVGALHHATHLGLALLRAQDIFGEDDPGFWSWAESVSGICKEHMRRYMRLAHYRDQLPEEAFTPWIDQKGGLRNPSPTRALHYVKGLPPLRYAAMWADGTQEEVVRLHTSGVPLNDISDITSVPYQTVYHWCNPERWAAYERKARQKRHARSAAKKALAEKQQRQERERLAKTTGGELAEAYALVRRLAVKLDAALKDAAPGDQRRSVDAALSITHRAEDEIVAALRSGRAVA